MSYKVAAPDEYLAITGMGIKNVKITKATWVYPFQRCMRFRLVAQDARFAEFLELTQDSVQPHDYAMNLQAMTKEKLQFLLPVVFTVGPDVNQRGANAKRGNKAQDLMASAGVEDHSVAGSSAGIEAHDHVSDHRREDRGDSLMKYAMLLADSGAKKVNNTHQFLENIVKGIIEGEVRVLVSSMTMEEIFTEREVFKRRIFRNIQGELVSYQTHNKYACKTMWLIFS